MKKNNIYLLRILVILIPVLFLSSCDELLDDEAPPVPTKTRMEGTWEVVEAYDTEKDTSILKKVKVLYLGFHLSSDNTINSTAGPMTTYLVYGDSKWTEISSTIDRIWDYTEYNTNGGEFFIESGVTDRFTIEMKLEGIGGSSTIKDILEIVGVNAEFLETVVYHKFMDVEVTFNDDFTQMTWDFDETTFTEYNIKNQYGNYVLWEGWNAPFRKCKFVLEKRSKDLKDLLIEANN